MKHSERMKYALERLSDRQNASKRLRVPVPQLAVVVSRNLFSISGQFYSGDSTGIKPGTAVYVVNAGRPAAAYYVPVENQDKWIQELQSRPKSATANRHGTKSYTPARAKPGPKPPTDAEKADLVMDFISTGYAQNIYMQLRHVSRHSLQTAIRWARQNPGYFRAISGIESGKLSIVERWLKEG